MRSKARTSVVVTAVVAGAALLGGCSPSPGTAAVVGDRTITRAAVEQTVADLTVLDPATEGRAVLVRAILAPYLIDAAAENGVGVSEDEIRTVLDDLAVSVGVTQIPDWSAGTIDDIRSRTALTDLQELPDAGEILAGVAEEILAADIDINPRYGELTAGTLEIREAVPTWIVPVAPAAG